MLRLGRLIALIVAPILILGLSIGFASAALAASPGAAAESIVTTLYAYPTLSSWGQVESAAPTVSAAIVDICAPDGSGSGCNGQPADAESTVWVPTIQALQAAGITPLYYIWTDYGATPRRPYHATARAGAPGASCAMRRSTRAKPCRGSCARATAPKPQ